MSNFKNSHGSVQNFGLRDYFYDITDDLKVITDGNPKMLDFIKKKNFDMVVSIGSNYGSGGGFSTSGVGGKCNSLSSVSEFLSIIIKSYIEFEDGDTDIGGSLIEGMKPRICCMKDGTHTVIFELQGFDSGEKISYSPESRSFSVYTNGRCSGSKWLKELVEDKNLVKAYETMISLISAQIPFPLDVILIDWETNHEILEDIKNIHDGYLAVGMTVSTYDDNEWFYFVGTNNSQIDEDSCKKLNCAVVLLK